MAEQVEATPTLTKTEDNSLFWTSEMINTFADVIPRDVKELAGQLHMVARDNMPVSIDAVSGVLGNGLWQLHEVRMDAKDFESTLNEAKITLPPRLKELILTRSTKMDPEGQLLLAQHSELLATITKEIAPAAVLRAQIQSDKDLIVDSVDRTERPQRIKLYEQLDKTLEDSINMVCFSHYLQELMRQGINDGKLDPTHTELAHQLDARILGDRGFLSKATQYLFKQGVRLTAEDLKTWGGLANFRNSLSSHTHSN